MFAVALQLSKEMMGTCLFSFREFINSCIIYTEFFACFDVFKFFFSEKSFLFAVPKIEM